MINENRRKHPSTPRQGTDQPALRRGLILIAVTAGYFLVLLDLTVINVTLPTIGAELGASVADQQWVIDAYTISVASLLLAGGKLGDLYGNKRVITLGMVVFGLSSLACGLAPTSGTLIGFRVVEGIGAAALLPGSLAIVTHTYHGDRAAQARAIGIWATVGSLAMPAGPLLGGLLVDFASWRAVFLINLPIIVISLGVILRLVRNTTDRDVSSLDLRGVVLGAAVLCALTITFIEGGQLGWAAPTVLAAAAACPVLLLAFLYVEHVRTAPLLPLSMFRSMTASMANIVTVLMSLVLLGTIFMTTQYFQVVIGYSALTTGVLLLPLFGPLAACSLVSGRLTDRRGPAFTASAGLLLGVLGMLVLTRVTPAAAYFPVTFLALLCVGAGIGLLTPAVVTAAMREAPREHTGIASGVNNTARQVGGAIGAALFGSIIGSPHQAESFLHGFHVAALCGAALWAVGLALTITLGRLSRI
ncbi:MAG: MFS transporter [Nocardioidaceae bacterium]